MRGALLAVLLWCALVGAAQAESALIEAIKRGDEAAALELARQRDAAAARESDGTTALHWAVHHDSPALVDRLLRSRADVHARNDYGATPMSEAAIIGNPEVIGRLLKAGADPESPNADGQTALMVVARTGKIEAAELLIRKGADVNAVERWRGQTALMWAAAERQPAMVRLLLEHGADPNARSVVNAWERQTTAESRVQGRPTGGLTPLLYAAREGCLDCVTALVEAGADVNLTDPDQISPLLMATLNARWDIARYLLGKGANPNKWDRWGRTPLYATVDYNTVPHGGRPDRPSLDDTTSLQLTELLLQAGANPNAQLKLFPPYRALGPDRGGDQILTIGATPLFRAAKAGDAAAMKVLLAHGALPDLPNIGGITPLMAAAGLGSAKIDTRGRFKTQDEAIAAIELLVAAGADINAQDRLGRTALHGAAFWGWNDVVQALVERGARLAATDNNGMTALDVAQGKPGAFGRATVEVHEDTAALLQQLMARGGS